MCCYARNSSCRPARKKAILQTVTEEYRGERKWPNPLWKHKALDCHPHRLTVKGKGEGKDAATLNIVYCVKLLWGELKSIEYKHMKKLKPRVDGPDFSKKMQKLLPMHTLSKGFKETLKGLVQLPKQAGMPTRTYALDQLGPGRGRLLSSFPSLPAEEIKFQLWESRARIPSSIFPWLKSMGNSSKGCSKDLTILPGLVGYWCYNLFRKGREMEVV